MKSHLILFILIVTLFKLPDCETVAQPAHGHLRVDDFTIMTRTLVAYLPNYAIEATIVPESLMVRGKVELHFRNLSGDTLREVYLDLGANSYPVGEMPHLVSLAYDSLHAARLRQLPHGYCRIDTLLYNVARLREKPLMLDSSLMKVFLPNPLLPGEEGLFIIVFETRLKDKNACAGNKPFVFNRWHPYICLYQNGRWFLGKDPLNDFRYSDYSLFRVVLKVDSAYDLVGSGHFINEKEHYGFLPRVGEGEVGIDILNRPDSLNDPGFYKLVFEKGYKEYHWRTQGVTTFPFVLSSKVKLDRINIEMTQVDLYCSPGTGSLQPPDIINQVVDIISEYRQQWGSFPYGEAYMFYGSDYFMKEEAKNFFLIPPNLNSPDTRYVFLAVKLAHSWLPETIPQKPYEGLFDEALAVFSAWKLLFDKFGTEGYRMAGDYETTIRNCCFRDDFSKNTFEYVYKTIPARLYMLDFCIGDSVFHKVLHDYITQNKYSYSDKQNFLDLVRDMTGQDYSWLFDLERGRIPDCDVYFDAPVRVVADDTGIIVRGSVGCKSPLVMPVEIALVINRADTIFTLISRDDLLTGRGKFSVKLSRWPMSVILDPGHRLPDNNRRNNYHFFQPLRFKYYPPENLFPAYREIFH